MAYYLYRDVGIMTAYPDACIDLIQDPNIICDYLPSSAEQKFAFHQYPNGLSRHGLQYLSASGENGFSNHIIESIFEMIRKMHYPNQPSRFQSAFACPDVESTRKWMNIFKPDEIWTINFDKTPKIFDASFLTVFTQFGFSHIQATINAHHYWKQDRSDDPLLEILLELPVRLGKRIPLDQL